MEILIEPVIVQTAEICTFAYEDGGTMQNTEGALQKSRNENTKQKLTRNVNGTKAMGWHLLMNS